MRASALTQQLLVLRAVLLSSAVFVTLCASHLAPLLSPLQCLPVPSGSLLRSLLHCFAWMLATAHHHPALIHTATTMTTTRIHVRLLRLTHATTLPAHAELTSPLLTALRLSNLTKAPRRHMNASFGHAAPATGLVRRISWAIASKRALSTTRPGITLPRTPVRHQSQRHRYHLPRCRRRLLRAATHQSRVLLPMHANILPMTRLPLSLLFHPVALCLLWRNFKTLSSRSAPGLLPRQLL